MYPIIERMDRIDENNTRTAVREMAAYIDRLVNQLERILLSLDSVNFNELDLSDMRMFTETGSEIAGDKIKIKCPDGQVFEVGYNKTTKQFVVTMPKISVINAGVVNADAIVRGGESI